MALYPELIRLGLLDYPAMRAKDGALFDLKPGPHGKLSGSFSKWWARYSDDCGVTDARKTFHSLRHVASDARRRAECPEDVKDSILGHAGASVGRRYGTGIPLPVQGKWVARIAYSGLEVT